MQFRAISVLLIAMLSISIMDSVVKMMSGGYALHQIVFTRAVISLMILLPFLMRYGLLAMQTQRPMGHLIRGLLLVTANVCFYTGLASLPLAEASAIVFLAPVFVTFLSWSFLDEKFGSSRWVAVFVGLVGMLFVMKPFSETIEVAFLWPLAAAFCYAGFTVATRYLGRTESAPLLAVTAQTSFVLVSGLVGITAGGGQFAGHADLGLEFLLRAWRWPETADLFYLIGIGILSSITALSLSYAYRNAEASFLAPFEYTILPFVLLWGYLLFDEFPDGLSLFGILLIAAGGLIIWLDGSRSRKKLSA